MNSRIGRVGENPAGFDTCLVDSHALQEQPGIEVVQLELDEVFDGIREADSSAVETIRASVRANVAGVDVLDTDATNGTLGTFVTLQKMADRRPLLA